MKNRLLHNKQKFHKIIRFFLIFWSFHIIYSCFFPIHLYSQNLDKSTKPFRFLTWPTQNSFIARPVSPEERISHLADAWYNGHLPTYTGKAMQIIQTKKNSIIDYKNMIDSATPECIEGDASFIEAEINRDKQLYIPILRQTHGNESYAELIFRSSTIQWKGTLGVVNQSITNAGKRQIAYWESHSSVPANWVAFYSADETLRHLLAGTIQVAAVPEGILETFLREQLRLSLLNQLARIRIPKPCPPPIIFLRKDLYSDLFIRTLVTETWLRNAFPNELTSTRSNVIDQPNETKP